MKSDAKPASPERSRAVDRAGAIYRALRHAIIEQALAPGAKLPEDTIGEQFGASRTIVRRVLSQLAAEGLVDLRPNRGAAVATPSWEEAHDTFEARLAMERLVIARLIASITREQLDQLRAHVEEEEQSHDAGAPRSIRLATEFHVLLAEMTGSPVLVRYVSELALRCGLILALYSRPHSSDCAVSEHREIIEALAAGEADRAVAVMDQHLGAVVTRALITPRAPKDRAIQDVLSAYAAGDPRAPRQERKR